MTSNKHIKLAATAALILATFISSINIANTFAAGAAFALSPMNQNIVLTPGESFEGTFRITNPASSSRPFEYEIRVEPFSVSDNNDISLTINGDYNQMVDWIYLPKTNGTIAINESEDIRFYIDVPENAAAGGQYASIMVSSSPDSVANANMNIQEVFESAHLVYAEVAGESIRKGELNEVNVPSFLFTGKISGSSRIKNLGNVHSQAVSTIQIFPLFSSEEVFTNEENPKKSWIMPGNNTYSTVTWEETPSFGIFHVVYHVEFEGVESKVDKYVIVCPIWLLFLILLAIFLIIFKIITGKKNPERKS